MLQKREKIGQWREEYRRRCRPNHYEYSWIVFHVKKSESRFEV